MDLPNKLKRFVYMGSTEACHVVKRKSMTTEEVDAALGFLKIVSVPQNPPDEQAAANRPQGKGDFKWQLTTFRVCITYKINLI